MLSCAATETNFIRPNDPEVVIMDISQPKTATEWWAYEKINELNGTISVLRNKVKAEFDHGKDIELRLSKKVGALTKINAELKSERDNIEWEISKLKDYEMAKYKRLASKYRKCLDDYADIKKENAELEKDLAFYKAGNVQIISIDELAEFERKSASQKASCYAGG